MEKNKQEVMPSIIVCYCDFNEPPPPPPRDLKFTFFKDRINAEPEMTMTCQLAQWPLLLPPPFKFKSKIIFLIQIMGINISG